MKIEGSGRSVPGPVPSLGPFLRPERGPVRLSLLRYVGAFAPDVILSQFRTGLRRAGCLEPGMLDGRVINRDLRDHLEIAAMHFVEERSEVLNRPQRRM